MSVEVRPVATEGERRAFLRFPWRIYRGRYPAWVPPLISEEKKRIDRRTNPFYEHGSVELFLAYRDGDMVGRIAAIENELHNEFHGEKIGFFGLFESIEDEEVAHGLLEAAGAWVRGRGLNGLRGPANFSLNEECGLLMDNFEDPPCILMTYNPPYYRELLESWGMVKARDLLAYSVRHDSLDVERLERFRRFAERARDRLNVRTLKMKEFEAEVDLVRELYNRSWERNWGFVPMTDAEVDYLAKALKPIVRPELVLFAEYKGEPVGFALALPDLNQALHHLNGRLLPFGFVKLLWYMRKIDRMRVLTLGLLEEHRRTGLDALLYIELFRRGRRVGIDVAESSWILEDNQMMKRALEKMGFERYKTYRLYERAFGPSGNGEPS